MDSIKKLAQKRLSRDVPAKGLDELISFIANNPLVEPEAVARKAAEMGYHPTPALSQTLGSVLLEKNSLNPDAPLEDILNSIYKDNPVPGERYIVNPNSAKSQLAKEVASELENSYGVSLANRKGSSRATPSYSAIEDVLDEKGKIEAIATAGHELKHGEDWLVRPHFNPVGHVGQAGHHYGPGTYEANQLIREVRGIPDDEKIAKEIVKRSKGAGSQLWKKLYGMAPVLAKGAAIGAGGLYSLASEAADTESTGDAPEQAALLREIDERKRREKNLAASPGIRMAAEKMYEEADSGKMFDARRDALRNLLRK